MRTGYTILTNSAFRYRELPPGDEAAIIGLYQTEGREKIYEYARGKKILPFVAVLLSKIGLDTDYWNDVASAYRKRNEAVIACLDTLFCGFSKKGVKQVFVTENFGAILAADVDKCLFASGDVDMYADPKEKERIYEVFAQLGYRQEERYSHRKLINTTFHNEKILPEGFHLGVAWHPLSRMKLPCFVHADDFIQWDRMWKYGDTAINLPDVDALAYICLLHISLHSFSRAPDIRLYVDIQNISMLPVNWEKIVDIAKRDGTIIRLLTAFILSESLVSVNVPEVVLLNRALYEKAVSRLIKLVYDANCNCLRYEPRGFELLQIEACSDDRSVAMGLLNVLFPDPAWVRDFYVGENGSLVAGYYRHILNLLGR